MRPESHPWLKWPGCSANRKIELNNKLVTLQNKIISQPRFIDWDMCVDIGIGEELDEMLLTKFEDRNGPLEIPLWRRAFDVREDSYREWSLEFYSSLEVRELPTRKDHIFNAPVIAFRLGGMEHKVTITRFGVLTGMFTQEEANHEEMDGYNLVGEWNSNEVKKAKDQVWYELSGKHTYTSASRAKSIKSPILRVVHKMIAYSFLHRSSQHDKVYIDDLWLLYLFSMNEWDKFGNAPWVLACYMMEKGAGRQSNSPMLCGHFITRIAKSLGLATPANIKRCSPAIGWRLITKHDLAISELIGPSGKVIEEEEGQQQHDSPPPPPSSGGSMRDEIFRIGRELDGTRRDVHGVGGYFGYHLDRYQPSWEAMAQQSHASMSGSSGGWPPYNPPPMFPPYQPEQVYQEGNGDEEEEED